MPFENDYLNFLPIELRKALNKEVDITDTPIAAAAQNISPSGGSQVPAFENTLYVRVTGDDTTGDGSLGNPYRTFVRAMEDVPVFILPGQNWTVDVTGITETLAASPGTNRYLFPPCIGATDNIFDFSGANYRSLRGAINVIADPTVLDTVTAGDIVSHVADPVTGLRTIVTSKTFVPGALKGKMLAADVFLGFATIYDNTATDLILAQRGFDFPTPFDIVEPSAVFTGPSGSVWEFKNTQAAVVLAGIRMQQSGTGRSLAISQGDKVTCLLCEINNYTIQATGGFFDTFGCYMNGVHRATMKGDRVVGSVSNFYRNFRWDELAPRGPAASYQAGSGCIYESCYPLGDWGEGESRGGGQFFVFNSLIVDAVSDGCRFNGNGQRSELTDVEIRDSTGNAVQVNGAGEMILTNVQGTGNGGLGVSITNGGKVLRSGSTAVTGTGGDFKVGGNAVGTWGGFSGDENDLAAGTSELCRMH